MTSCGVTFSPREDYQTPTPTPPTYVRTMKPQLRCGGITIRSGSYGLRISPRLLDRDQQSSSRKPRAGEAQDSLNDVFGAESAYYHSSLLAVSVVTVLIR